LIAIFPCPLIDDLLSFVKILAKTLELAIDHLAFVCITVWVLDLALSRLEIIDKLAFVNSATTVFVDSSAVFFVFWHLAHIIVIIRHKHLNNANNRIVLPFRFEEEAIVGVENTAFSIFSAQWKGTFKSLAIWVVNGPLTLLEVVLEGSFVELFGSWAEKLPLTLFHVVFPEASVVVIVFVVVSSEAVLNTSKDFAFVSFVACEVIEAFAWHGPIFPFPSEDVSLGEGVDAKTFSLSVADFSPIATSIFIRDLLCMFIF
jgi:hypothetical protein